MLASKGSNNRRRKVWISRIRGKGWRRRKVARLITGKNYQFFFYLAILVPS
jgi:uncharacterized protein YfiM (DUF2279 family)